MAHYDWNGELFPRLVQTACVRACQFRLSQPGIYLSVAKRLSILAIEGSTKLDLQAPHSIAAALFATGSGFQGPGYLLQIDELQSADTHDHPGPLQHRVNHNGCVLLSHHVTGVFPGRRADPQGNFGPRNRTRVLRLLGLRSLQQGSR